MEHLLHKTGYWTHDEKKHMGNILDKIRRISGFEVKVELECENGSISIYIKIVNPLSHRRKFYKRIESPTFHKALTELTNCKIVKCRVDEETQELLARYKTDNVDFTFEECPVCRDLTDFDYWCKHTLCPNCFVKCSKCPVCRYNLDDDNEDDEEED